VPAFVLRHGTDPYGTGPFRRLNPTTRLVVALSIAAVAFGVRGWTGPLSMLAVGLALAGVGRLGRTALPYVAATLPIVASILLVDTFLYPASSDVIATIGPFRATGSGLAAALQAALRVEAFALSVAVLALTTPTDDLLDDLEQHGAGRRATFVVGSAIRTVPRTLQRAREITDAQRARGLDTEGSPWRRLRGVIPLAGPMVLSALAEVEDRTMALEARGFSAPGRRASLRPFRDSGRQRAIRWGLPLLAAALVGASIAGRLQLP
jgi:energy-coupling factor transport system permease protein